MKRTYSSPYKWNEPMWTFTQEPEKNVRRHFCIWTNQILTNSYQPIGFGNCFSQQIHTISSYYSIKSKLFHIVCLYFWAICSGWTVVILVSLSCVSGVHNWCFRRPEIPAVLSVQAFSTFYIFKEHLYYIFNI